MSIKPLRPEAASALRSSLIISSLPQCLIELVHNALDADSSVIDVLVNFAPASGVFLLRVEDNGRGIAEEDLAVLGTRYGTKLPFSLWIGSIRFTKAFLWKVPVA